MEDRGGGWFADYRVSEAPIEIRVDGLPELTEFTELPELATATATASASCASMIKCAIFCETNICKTL